MLNLAQNKKLGGWNMPKKEDHLLTFYVMGVTNSSKKDVVTCQDIKDNLSAREIDQYSRDAIRETMESISDQLGEKFKFIIVTRRGRAEFAIRKTEKCL